jgi:hypothetical protein
MTFPSASDTYVPSNGPDFLAISNFTPAYVPFTTLQAVRVSPAADSFAYAKRLVSPATFAHVVRCFYFTLALLYTGFPSGTPGAAQIGFEELTLRLYHTALLHCRKNLCWLVSENMRLSENIRLLDRGVPYFFQECTFLKYQVISDLSDIIRLTTKYQDYDALLGLIRRRWEKGKKQK